MSTDLINLSVSRRKPLKDQVTPYKLALLVLIDEHCKLAMQMRKGICTVWYSDEEELLFLSTLLNLVQSPDVDLKTFNKLVLGIVKHDIMTNVAERLRCIYDEGVNALMNLMQTLPANVFQLPDGAPAAAMSKNSVCGLFIRRQCLAFDKLPFSQVTQLYHKFRAAYSSVLSEQSSVRTEFCGSRDSTGIIDAIDGDASLSLGDFTDKRIETKQPRAANVDSGHYSQRQAEYFIAQQTFLLSHNELEALTPREMQNKISTLLQSNPDMAEVHYLSYLNCLRLQEYCGALDSLHSYYDHSPTLSSQMTAPNANKSKMPDDETMTRVYRYAVLGLAATQFKFGHRKEALLAVQESIRIAQEANDSVCLQHALGWLQRLGIQIDGGQGFLLEKLVSAAGELNLAYLTSLGVQAFARHSALSAVKPAHVFEYLIKSEVLNCQHFLSDLVSISLSQKAALWDIYGRSEMCLLAAQLVLSLNSQESGVYHNTESDCVALCYIAKYHADQGLYDLAFDVIHSARDRFPLSTAESRIWMACEQQIHFTVALNRSCHSAAEQAVSCLAGVDKLEASYCKCCLLADKCESSQLIESVDAVIADCRQRESSQQHFNQLIIKLLLLKGNALCSTSNATIAIQPLLDALCIAKQNHYMLLAALTTVHLAFVQYSLGSPKLALDHIAQIYPVVMTHGSLFDRARMLNLDVKCRLALAARYQSTERTQVLKSCVNKIHSVITWYKKLECYQRLKDAYYLQSRLCHELGLNSQRNKYALEFHHLDLQYPTANVAFASQL